MEQLQSVALLIPEIKELLAQKNFALLKQVMRECNPIHFADCWKRFSEDERLHIFMLLPTNSALKLFEILDIEDQRYLIGKLNEENMTPILEGMNSQELARIFHKMPQRAVNKMTSLIKRQEALAHIDLLMQYPEHSAGSLMHPEFVKLTPRLTAKQALSRLQAITRPNQKEHLYSLFVTDDEGKVLGALTLQELVSAPEDMRLSELMTSIEGVKVRPDTDQEEVAQLFAKYHLDAVPVTDESCKLLGVLTTKDIISIVRQEATEDIAKMVGTKAMDLKERSVFRIVKLRTPWLVMTLFAGLLNSVLIRYFEPVLAQVIALASFLPLIAGMGGNVGSQSATIMVRNIALGTVNGHNKIRTIFREMRVGMLLGLMYGIIMGGVAFFAYGSVYHFRFSVVVALGMATSMTVAATMGAIGPLILDRFGVDPATATGPLITTTTDTATILTYFTLASFLLLNF